MTIQEFDAVALTSALVRLDTRNPSLVPGAPGEMPAVRLLAELLPQWGFRVEVQDLESGRANLVARIGRAGGPVLMFNGHLDVVEAEGMTHDAFGAEVRNGRLYGRGSADMKAGVAAMCAAAARATRSGLESEIVVACVADEEYESMGTRALIDAGVRADAAVVTEPTCLAICPAHRGFVWVELEFRGRAAHGSRYEIGIDAIRHAAAVLSELDRHERVELVKREHPLLGRASLHAATIEGGAGWTTYPDRCVLRVERRTIPGESPDMVLREVQDAIARARSTIPDISVDVKLLNAQNPSDVSPDAPVVRALESSLTSNSESVRIEGISAWTDAALLNEAGIPAVCFGPGDIALAHSPEEWVPVDEIERATAVLEHLAGSWHRARA